MGLGNIIIKTVVNKAVNGNKIVLMDLVMKSGRRYYF